MTARSLQEMGLSAESADETRRDKRADGILEMKKAYRECTFSEMGSFISLTDEGAQWRLQWDMLLQRLAPEGKPHI